MSDVRFAIADETLRMRSLDSDLRIAVCSSLWPHPTHSVRAANVVIFELVRALAAVPGVVCGFVRVGSDQASSMTPDEERGAHALTDSGVTLLPEVRLNGETERGPTWRRLVLPEAGDFYPAVGEWRVLWSALESFRPHVVLVPWSEWLTAVCARLPVVKFAYYGNPDAKSARARVKFARAHGDLSLLDAAVQALSIRALERTHLRIIRQYELLGNVAANDARYYADHGHSNAFYVRNVWVDRTNGTWRLTRERVEQSGVIIGNVGRLDGTGNTLALEVLGRHFMPALRRRLPSGGFRVRVLGAGSLPRAVADVLHGHDVEIAGFVPDVDQALLEAGVFLCLNNATGFKVGQTRYLHAWSLGACVIAHRDAALSMPEIVHGYNALLGDSIDEIAAYVAAAIGDAALRRRLGDNGYRTFCEFFTARRVAADIVERIRMHVDHRRTASGD